MQPGNPLQHHRLFVLFFIIVVPLFCAVVVLTNKFSMYQSSGAAMNSFPTTKLRLEVSTTSQSTTVNSKENLNNLSENLSNKLCLEIVWFVFIAKNASGARVNVTIEFVSKCSLRCNLFKLLNQIVIKYPMVLLLYLSFDRKL